MTSDTFLAATARVLAERRASYGPADVAMEAIAARWSVTLGRPVSPAQVVLCLIDLKLARLARNPAHEDSRGAAHQRRHLRRRWDRAVSRRCCTAASAVR